MLDATSRAILKEYRESIPVYQKIKEIVDKKLKDIISDYGMIVNSVEGRIKTEKSLKGKLELKGYKYKTLSDITDILGERIVTFYSDEVDKIASSIEKEFAVVWEKSVDKRRILSVDQFGYMSLHFICTVPKSLYYDENNEKVNLFPFEIQIRTVLQHAWATIYHDTGYKTDVEIPKEYLRGLNRLAGILELADEEFKRIRVSIDEYRKKVKALVKDGNFNEMELNGDTFKAYIGFGAFDKINKRIAEINNMDVIDAPLDRFLTVFKKLGCNTLGDVEKIINDNFETAYRFALAQFGGTDIDIIASTVGATCVCVVYVLASGKGTDGLQEFYKLIYGDRKSNEKLIQKAFEIGKKIGIIV